MKRFKAIAILAAMVIWLSATTAHAFGPYDEWALWSRMQEMPGIGFGAPGFFGSPRSGPGYNAWGYNYFNPYAGPPITKNGKYAMGTLSFYSPWSGPGGVGDGWDGAMYGFYAPGAITMWGLYGLGDPAGNRLYGGWN